MTHDFCGLAVALPPDAAPAWDATVRGFLAHAAATPDHLAETLRRAPHFALGHAARGLFLMLLGRRELAAAARDAHAAALAGAGDTRADLYVAALGDWLAGRPRAAADRMEAVLARWPADALAMKLAQAINFVMGRGSAMRASTDRLEPLWREHPARGYLLGCRAFALEEGGDYAAALRAGEQALALAPDDAWGLHAVAHVHDMTGRAAAGLAWLTPRRAAWAHCNNFRFHVWWHMALMEIDLGRCDAALALYDAEVRASPTDDYRDVANAASLLVRLELEGVDVGRRWAELADIAERRSEDGCVVFADLHYLLALLGDRRRAAAEALLARMARSARGSGEMDGVARDPGLDAAGALAAMGRGEHARAAAGLARAAAGLPRIGGSHAQRDVFERLRIEAAMRAGLLDAAEAALAARTGRRGAEDGYAARRLAMIARARAAAA